MKHKILYVEDEPFLSKVVKETLEHQGFDVQLVKDGALVVQAFDRFEPDICVLDVMLPNIDGFALGRIIKVRKPEIPIIFLTAKSFTEDVLAGFEVGATDYVRKPFSIEELIVRIQNQLRLRINTPIQQAIAQPVQLGSYVFSPDRLELKYGEEHIKLSYRETQVLSLLTANLNQPTDRKELLLAVWGDDSFFNSRTLDVYIRKLRTYLQNDPKIEIITLKGKGYVFHVG
ncbi:MAG: response regulator transcription factor [Flavobacteriia bacterium]|nr:response regulator transcription factor [Flavobacteriia bacterium]